MNINKKIFKDLGLTENEITLYLCLLKLGSSTASQIAKNSGIYRPYVYDTVEKLLEKGLVSYIITENKRVFQAVHPHHLLDIQQQKTEQLLQIMPQLESFVKLSKEESKVNHYSGKKVVRTIQKDVLHTLLKERTENCVIGVNEKRFMEIDSVIMHQFFNQMKKNKLKERILVREGDNYLPGHKEVTTYRFLPKQFFDPTSTFIYGNKVAIIIFSQPLHGIIIKSALLAQTYRKQFELLWQYAKEKH